MKALFLGSFYKHDYLKFNLNPKNSTALTFASNNHQLSIVEGLNENLNNNLFCLTRISVPYYPEYGKIFIKDYCIDEKTKIVGFVNIRFLRKITSINRIYKNVVKLIKKYNIKNIISYELPYDFDIVMKKIKKKFKNKVNTIVIIPDIPSIMLNYGKPSLISKLIASSENNLHHYDKFVVLTSQMIEYLKLNKDNCYVMDGLFSKKVIDFDNIEYKKGDCKTILYTGTLRKEFNILQLVRAFKLIKTDEKICLEIAGSGDGVEEILKASQEDNRIKYLGVLDKEQIRIKQKNATILINPRKPDSADSKYSFPSKTIEYMLSGRPLIMSYLPGMDKKYFDYIFELDCSSDEAMARSIEKVICIDEIELTKIGERAKKFVEINNNCIVKTKGIINLLKKS